MGLITLSSWWETHAEWSLGVHGWGFSLHWIPNANQKLFLRRKIVSWRRQQRVAPEIWLRFSYRCCHGYFEHHWICWIIGGNLYNRQNGLCGRVAWTCRAFPCSGLFLKPATNRELCRWVISQHTKMCCFQSLKRPTKNLPLFFSWKWKSLSHVQLFSTPWTIQSMEFSRPEYWSGWLFPSLGDLPNPGKKPRAPHCRQVFY